MKKKLVISILIFIFILIVLSTYSFIPVVETEKLNSINPIRFALVSDLHSCYYGKNQKTLVEMIEKENPDFIFLTGDIFDDKIEDTNSKIFLENVSSKYECFYVSGNHEVWSRRLEEIKAYLKSINVKVLEGDCESIEIKNRTIDVCGISDPYEFGYETWKVQLKNAYSKTKSENQKILLSHRPEKISDYENYDFDLILCGHAHAGQWLIPFFNRGVYAPNQGFFAKYVNGKYKLSNNSTMIVSRGLARESTLAPRFFNRPEIIIIEF